MIKSFLDPIKLGIIECMFEKIGTGATIAEIQASLPRNAKYHVRNVKELEENEVIVCDNPEAPENEQKYSGNKKSKIFTSLFTVDIELSDRESGRKKKLRSQMLAGAKKG